MTTASDLFFVLRLKVVKPTHSTILVSSQLTMKFNYPAITLSYICLILRAGVPDIAYSIFSPISNLMYLMG